MKPIIIAFISIFSVYGIFSIIYDIIYSYFKNHKNKGFSVCKIIKITEEDNNLEEYLRYLSAVKTEAEDVILILNENLLNNKFNQGLILEAEFDFVKFMQSNEYLKYIKENF